MKTIPSPLLALILWLTASVSHAAPWDFFRPRPTPPRYEERQDYRDRRGDGYYHREDRPTRLEARVQFRLRQLGFYRGPVDGDMGRGSRAALARFQHSRGLRPTGAINPPTLRALRL